MNTLRLDKTAIVIVEIQQEDKPVEIRYITMGIVGNETEQGIGNDALEYLKDVEGVKNVKEICCAESEAYRIFLENNLKESFSSND